MTEKSDAEGTLAAAVRNTERLMEVDPKLAVDCNFYSLKIFIPISPLE